MPKLVNIWFKYLGITELMVDKDKYDEYSGYADLTNYNENLGRHQYNVWSSERPL